MNLETSLNTYRATCDPSIAISDAQAAWILKWAEANDHIGILHELSRQLAVWFDIDYSEVEDCWSGGIYSAAPAERNYWGKIHSFERLFELMHAHLLALQSPTEKKCCKLCFSHLRGKEEYCACPCHRKEHEEHQD